jgi:AcrR family transcriptional regulator
MVSSALYRYFASRDELLTALILDGYNALGAAVEAADAAVTGRGLLRDRWREAGRAIRTWALANPAEYALLYGSPVPGYVAPPDTIAAAARTPVVLARILADGFDAGAVTQPGVPPGAPLPGPLRDDLARASAGIAPGLPEELMLTGITAWLQVFGTISFELFGQFNNVIDARAEFFDQQLELMADVMGL